MEAVEAQQSFFIAGQAPPKLGEVLAQKGYITHEQIGAVLRGQTTMGAKRKRFGEIAVTHHFCSQAEIDAALQVQGDLRAFASNPQRLGEILVTRGALRPHQVLTILQQQGNGQGQPGAAPAPAVPPPPAARAASQLVDCPLCQTRLNVTGVSANGQIRCPTCQAVFIPGDVASPAPPPNIPTPVYTPAVHQPQTYGSGGGAPAPSRSLIGAAVGQYQIESKLGEDSTGVLYKAFDPRTGARVALRMLDPAVIGRQEDYERWVSAEQAARELSHRNLQKILTMSAEGGRPYLVMEFIEGDSLRKIMQRRGVFPAVDAVGILLQLAEALEYGASRGLLHGDLRPVHVLLGVDGVARLSGLGIPKNAALNLRQVAGQFADETVPLYTPPEVMIDPEQADERSDIFSLGAIGYHLLTGRPPHEGAGILQLGFRMAASRITPARELNPRIPEYVSKLLGRCLQLDANARYDSPTLMLNDLRRARSAIMAGDEAPDLTDSLRTSNYLSVTNRAKFRKGRLKRLTTHISRGGHSGFKKPGGASNARMPAVGSSSGPRLPAVAAAPSPPQLSALPPLPQAPQPPIGSRGAASSSLNRAIGAQPPTAPIMPLPRAQGAAGFAAPRASGIGAAVPIPQPQPQPQPRGAPPGSGTFAGPRTAGASGMRAAIPGSGTFAGPRTAGASGVRAAVPGSGTNKAPLLPPLPVRGAGSSSSIPAVRAAGSSASNPGVGGFPLPISAQPEPPREDISDILNEVNPMAAPARSGSKTYEVIEQVYLGSKESARSNPSGHSGSARVRPARKPKRFANSSIVITCVISVVVLGAGVAAIYFTTARSSNITIAEPGAKLSDGGTIKTQAPPATEETQDWHLFEEFAKAHPKDNKEIVTRLHFFLQNHPAGDHAAKANEQLKQISALGIKDSMGELREKIANFTKLDFYDDATRAIEKWQDEWKGGAETAALAAALKTELAESRKTIATNLLSDAAQLRKDQKFADARALYDRVMLRFPQEFKNDAAKGRLDADTEEKALKNANVAEEKNKKAEEEKAARIEAAPAVFDSAAADYAKALKTFDLAWAKNTLEGAAERLAGTPKEAGLKALKQELDRLTALRDRMVKAIKDGKLRDIRVKYQGQDCQLPDASADGPVLQVGAGTVPVKWTQLGPDELSDIAGRVTPDDDGPALYDAGVLRYYVGKYLDAFKSLNAAQKKGADAAHFIDLAQAGMKELTNKDEAARKQAAAEAQAETEKILAAAKLVIRHGLWRAAPNPSGVYSVAQDPSAEDPTLMSLQRNIKKGFKSVSIEVRGTGEAAGFSFSGKGRRFLVKPSSNWQKVSIERDKDGVVMKVDDEVTQSIEKIAFDVTPANLVADGIIYIRFVGTKGEFRNLQVDE